MALPAIHPGEHLAEELNHEHPPQSFPFRANRSKFYPIKRRAGAGSLIYWRIGGPETNAMDAAVLCFQQSANLPRSKSRVRIPFPAL